MRLKKHQREFVLSLLAQGLESDEINEQAARFDLPFRVLRSQLSFYRRTRALQIDAIIKSGEISALTSGLAVRAERVKELNDLAIQLEKYIFSSGKLWQIEPKEVAGERILVTHFNASLVEQFRGILNDIALELGQRQ